MRNFILPALSRHLPTFSLGVLHVRSFWLYSLPSFALLFLPPPPPTRWTSPLLFIQPIKALALAALTHNARAGASIFTAGSSHQLRDATRRGLWLYPPRGPKTPPLGYPVYLLAQVLLPLSMALCLRCGAMPRCRRGVRGEVLPNVLLPNIMCIDTGFCQRPVDPYHACTHDSGNPRTSYDTIHIAAVGSSVLSGRRRLNNFFARSAATSSPAESASFVVTLELVSRKQVDALS